MVLTVFTAAWQDTLTGDYKGWPAPGFTYKLFSYYAETGCRPCV